VSCLPVLVLGMGTALAHMLRADTASTDMTDSRAAGPATPWSPVWSPADQTGPDQDPAGQGQTAPAEPGPPEGTSMPAPPAREAATQTTPPAPQVAEQPSTGETRLIASRLAAAGKPVSRRALRSIGVRGSNEALNALARKISAELAGATTPPPGLGGPAA